MLSIALGWQLYERTHSAFALGLVGLAQVVPVVGLVVAAGDAADRYSRKNIGALTQLLQALVAAGIAVVSRTHAPLPIIYALLFVSGIGNAYASTAISAILPGLVPKDQLVQANAWSSISFQLAATTGPAFAGFFLGAIGDATPLYIAEAIASLVFAIILYRLPAVAVPPNPNRARNSRDLLAGLRFVFRCKELLGAITLDLFAVLLGGVSALMPIFAKDVLHVGPNGLGMLLASPSLGALIVFGLQTNMAPSNRSGRVLLMSVAGFGAATLGFAFSRSLPLSMALLFLTGAFDAFSVVIRRTLEQVVTPDRLRGRVGAVHFVFLGMSNGNSASSEIPASRRPCSRRSGSVILGGVGTLVAVVLAAAAWPELRRMGRARPRCKPFEEPWPKKSSARSRPPIIANVPVAHGPRPAPH